MSEVRKAQFVGETWSKGENAPCGLTSVPNGGRGA